MTNSIIIVEAHITGASRDYRSSSMQQRVLVVSSSRQPLMPCHPARARQLLREGRAAKLRRYPFTIILKNRCYGDRQAVELKVDPGSKVTGIALIADLKRGKTVIWGVEVEHRGKRIKSDLDSRRAIRRSRRNRKIRYRQARFDNRTRSEGWLPPSLRHRVYTALTWVKRLIRFTPVTGIAYESVRFDMQLMENPEISGIEYQQGALAGYEIREYLLDKWGRACAYCDATDKPLQIEHVVSRANGGTDRVSNLVIACKDCNERKGTQDICNFLAHDKPRLDWIIRQLKSPLKDAAALNATRYALRDELFELGLPLETGSGGRTKFNRVNQGYPKTHWIDAACVGESGSAVRLDPNMKVLKSKAVGHGSRQMCRMNKFGFPRTKAKAASIVNGFRTGDMARLNRLSGKYAGQHGGSVVVRATGMFDVKTIFKDRRTRITAPACQFTKLHGCDGYAYI